MDSNHGTFKFCNLHILYPCFEISYIVVFVTRLYEGFYDNDLVDATSCNLLFKIDELCTETCGLTSHSPFCTDVLEFSWVLISICSTLVRNLTNSV